MNNISITESKVYDRLLKYSSSNDLIRNLRLLGFTGSNNHSQYENNKASWRPLNRSQLLELYGEYDKRFKCSEGVFSSYKILILEGTILK